MPNQLEVAMIYAHDQVLLLLLKVYQPWSPAQLCDCPRLTSSEGLGPVRGKNEWVVNEGMLTWLYQVSLTQSLNICIVYILDGGLNSPLGNVTSHQLYVDLVPLPQLLQVIQFLLELQILLTTVYRPVLKR